MQTLKYTVIKTTTQYKTCCKILEQLLSNTKPSKAIRDEIELLTLLIEKYQQVHFSTPDADPVCLIRQLMAANHIKATELAALLGVSKGLMSDILHYKKGLSKLVIRKLSVHFKLNQEAFNRPYKLIVKSSPELTQATVKKTMATA